MAARAWSRVSCFVATVYPASHLKLRASPWSCRPTAIPSSTPASTRVLAAVEASDRLLSHTMESQDRTGLRTTAAPAAASLSAIKWASAPPRTTSLILFTGSVPWSSANRFNTELMSSAWWLCSISGSRPSRTDSATPRPVPKKVRSAAICPEMLFVMPPFLQLTPTQTSSPTSLLIIVLSSTTFPLVKCEELMPPTSWLPIGCATAAVTPPLHAATSCLLTLASPSRMPSIL
mmetsp:Transcript_15303/g.36115  ORF Transcript_15303/g.36115 Transcript_15303/m.36115 type:complete len:233 (-) Transcript_15303:759-1457(-)